MNNIAEQKTSTKTNEFFKPAMTIEVAKLICDHAGFILRNYAGAARKPSWVQCNACMDEFELSLTRIKAGAKCPTCKGHGEHSCPLVKPEQTPIYPSHIPYIFTPEEIEMLKEVAQEKIAKRKEAESWRTLSAEFKAAKAEQKQAEKEHQERRKEFSELRQELEENQKKIQQLINLCNSAETHKTSNPTIDEWVKGISHRIITNNVGKMRILG